MRRSAFALRRIRFYNHINRTEYVLFLICGQSHIKLYIHHYIRVRACARICAEADLIEWSYYRFRGVIVSGIVPVLSGFVRSAFGSRARDEIAALRLFFTIFGFLLGFEQEGERREKSRREKRNKTPLPSEINKYKHGGRQNQRGDNTTCNSHYFVNFLIHNYIIRPLEA